MPKIGPDPMSISKIRRVLDEHPDGIWIREIARKTGIPIATVSHYLRTCMKEEIEEIRKGVPGNIKMVKRKKVPPSATPPSKKEEKA